MVRCQFMWQTDNYILYITIGQCTQYSLNHNSIRFGEHSTGGDRQKLHGHWCDVTNNRNSINTNYISIIRISNGHIWYDTKSFVLERRRLSGCAQCLFILRCSVYNKFSFWAACARYRTALFAIFHPTFPSIIDLFHLNCEILSSRKYGRLLSGSHDGRATKWVVHIRSASSRHSPCGWGL